MQNKGFVKFLAVALTLICIFYLSFSAVTAYQDKKIAALAETDSVAAAEMEDSLNTERFYLWNYTLKDCRNTAIGLGLDLKGGMNVILEVSVPDVVENLSGHNQDLAFQKAVKAAKQEAAESQSDFISAFVSAYKKEAPNGKLAQIFATQQLKGKVNTNSTDSEVEKVLRDEVDAAVDNSFRVLRTRIDRFGVVQPNIQKIEGQSGRIMVELPGIKEPDRVRKLLQGSANLEFWTTYDAPVIAPLLQQLNTKLAEGDIDAPAAETDSTATAAVEQKADSVSADSAKKENSLLAAPKDAEGTTAAASIDKQKNPLYSVLMPGLYERGCIVGYAAAKDTAEVNRLVQSAAAQSILPNDLRLLWGVKGVSKKEMVGLIQSPVGAQLFGKTPREDYVYELYAINVSGGQNGRAPLEGDVVTDATGEFDQFGKPVVSMKMNTEGARIWSALTEANKNHAIAIVLDGLVYSAPNVNDKIDGGSSQISGNFTTNDTKDLANVLSSGKMPAPAQIIQEEIVGPSLGQESINAGLLSFVIAFVVLMVYMCLMYGFKPGMVANCALILNFFFTLGILTSFQAALTMSGIAGMVLTLGTAVDANVLIYERTKEEMRAGKNLKAAIAAGYSNAFSAILDSNVTSFITGVILYYFGTGPIRGFATTLMIGIVCSFFTAVWLTRIVYEHQLNRDKWLGLTFVTGISKNLMKDTKMNFMGSFKKSFAIFGVIVLACVASLVIRGLKPSIDFTGGRNFKVEFAQQVDNNALEKALQNKFASLTKEAVSASVIAIGTEGTNVRVSTNYRIKEADANVDSDIEKILYETFVEQKAIDGNKVSLANFVDRDNRVGGSIISSQKVGPAIAEDITYGAIWSVLLALVAIFLYILVRFRNVAYSVGAIGALAIDTFLIIGMYSICHGWIGFSLEIDQTFIGAILTAIGYSINDKVVIFDRIRENFKLYPKRDNQRLFNESLNQTLARTINTSVSTLIVLLAIFIFGGDSIRSFAFAMILGVIFGTISSLLIAAPTAYLVMGRKIKEVEAEA